jgi:hypothetical protein
VVGAGVAQKLSEQMKEVDVFLKSLKSKNKTKHCQKKKKKVSDCVILRSYSEEALDESVGWMDGLLFVLLLSFGGNGNR